MSTSMGTALGSIMESLGGGGADLAPLRSLLVSGSPRQSCEAATELARIMNERRVDKEEPTKLQTLLADTGPTHERAPRVDCPQCDRRGWVGPEDPELHHQTERCPSCRGLGTVPAGQACRCGGSGWMRDARSAPHQVRGVPCGSCGAGQNVIKAMAMLSGVPPAYRGFTLASYAEAVGDDPDKGTALAYAQELAKDPRAFQATTGGRQGLLLLGPPGTGKTGLCVAILHKLQADWPTATFAMVKWEGYLKELQATWDSSSPITEASIVERYARADVLILDDVGQRGDERKQWRAEKLQELVDARMTRSVDSTMMGLHRVTMVTTNLDTVEAFGEVFDARVASRLNGITIPVDLGGEDLRARPVHVLS